MNHDPYKEGYVRGLEKIQKTAAKIDFEWIKRVMYKKHNPQEEEMREVLEDIVSLKEALEEHDKL